MNQRTRLDPDDNRRALAPIVYVVIAALIGLACLLGCQAGIIIRIGVH